MAACRVVLWNTRITSIFAKRVLPYRSICVKFQPVRNTHTFKCLSHTKTVYAASEFHTSSPTCKDSPKPVGITDSLLNHQTESNKGFEHKDESEEKKSDGKWRGIETWKLSVGLVVVWVFGFCICIVSLCGKPLVSDDGTVFEDEFSEYYVPLARILRTKEFLLSYAEEIREPSRKKLLPDPLQEPYYQPPYTLVLELNGVLLHPDYTARTGWRFKKRPGLEYLLETCAPPLYEIVIYTKEDGMTAFPLVNSLDPKGYIMYRLFRDSTRYMNRHHHKDLHCLNRDLSKVIIIDYDRESFSLTPRNGLALKKWKGEDEDRALYDLANLLKTLATQGVEDVRDVIDYYKQYEDPLQQYRENQAKAQEEEEKLEQLRQEDMQRRIQTPLKGALSSWFK